MTSKEDKVQMVMKLVDETTPILKKIKEELADFETEANKPKNKGFKALVSSIFDLNNAVRNFVGLKIVKSLAGISKAVLNASSDMTELQNVTDQVFGNMSEDVENFAKTMGEQMGRSTYALKKYVSDMGAILKGLGGISNESIKEMAQNLSALAVDIGSFKNVSDEEVFNAIRGGIVGETESLKRLGIVLNDTTLKEYALSQGIKTKWENMQASEKAQLRYQKLMEVTTFMQGDASRTINSYANQIKVLEANMGNLAVTIGNKFTGATAGVLGGVNSILSGFNNWLNSKSMSEITADAVSQKIQIDSLINRYKELKTQLKSAKKDTDEYKTKQTELKAVQQKLIDINPEFLKVFQSQKGELQDLKNVYQQTIDKIFELSLAQNKANFLQPKLNKLNKDLQNTTQGKLDSDKAFRENLQKATNLSTEELSKFTTEELYKKFENKLKKEFNNKLEKGYNSDINHYSNAYRNYVDFSNAANKMEEVVKKTREEIEYYQDVLEPEFKKVLNINGIKSSENNKNDKNIQPADLGSDKNLNGLLDSKEKSKWEKLQDDLIKINNELDRSLLTPIQLESIKRLSIAINEKQNQNIDNLNKIGIIDNSKALNEKINNTENVIKNLTLLSKELNKDDPRLKDIANKIKITKSNLEKLKNEAKEQSFLDKLSEYINNTKFEYSDNTKAVANKKIQENLNISLSKNEENYNNNLITINEYAKRKIDIIKKAINLQQELGNKEELAINIKKEYLAKLDELAIQNKQSIDISNIRNEITKHIENVGKYAIDLLNIEDIRSKYNSSKEQLFKAIENLPESIKGLIDIKKPLKQQFDTILKDSKLLKEDKLIVERIKELYNTTEKTYKEINKKQKQMNLPKVIEENLSFSLEQIKKLSKSFNNDALNDIVNEFTNAISSISSVGIKAATGDYAGAIKDALSYIVGFVSNIISNFTVDYNKKAKEDYEKRQDELISNTKALNELKENILSLNSSIIKLASSNTSNENLESNRKLSQALSETYASNFNPKLLINGTSKRTAKKWQTWETALSIYNPLYALFRGIYSAAALKKENVSYTKNFTDLFNTKGKTSKELQELYDTKIKHLNNENLKQFLDKKNNKFVDYEFTNIHSNLEEIKKQFLKRIEDVKKLEFDNKKFKENAIFESFDGISVVDLEAKKKEMLNKFKSLVKDEKELERLLPEFEKKVDELLKGQDKIITAFDDTRNNIISGLANGNSVIDTLANGLQSYFNKIRKNIAKVKYDLEFREFENFEGKFVEKFKKIHESLVKLRLSNKKSIKDLDPSLLDFSSLFSQLKKLSNVSDDMKDIIQELRNQAKAQGLSDEVINQMLPLDKVNEKVKAISEALKNAMHLALDTSSFNQFNMSLGQSLYNQVKENLIKAFIDSNKFQQLYKQYIDTPEFNKQLNNTKSIKEWYDLIQKQLKLTENKLKSEGLGFKETDASNGEYLGSLTNRTGLENGKSSLIERGTKIEVQQTVNNYGYLAIDDMLNGLVEMVKNKLSEQQKKEV